MERRIGAAPTLVYPESDGEPLAESPKHQKAMIDIMGAIRGHFRGIPDVFVAGNMFLYYEKGNPRKSVSPDVFMVRGVSSTKELRTYKTWEQPPTLDFVLEVASPSTYTKDFNEKMELYAKVLRVKTYCIYDPYHEIDPYFVGFRLVGDTYEEVPIVNGRIPIEVLGLELGEHKGVLRLYDPVKSAWLLTSEERADEAETHIARVETRASEAETRASEAETRASEEARARQAAEKELAELRETLERMKGAE